MSTSTNMSENKNLDLNSKTKTTSNTFRSKGIYRPPRVRTIFKENAEKCTMCQEGDRCGHCFGLKNNETMISINKK